MATYTTFSTKSGQKWKIPGNNTIVDRSGWTMATDAPQSSTPTEGSVHVGANREYTPGGTAPSVAAVGANRIPGPTAQPRPDPDTPTDGGGAPAGPGSTAEAAAQEQPAGLSRSDVSIGLPGAFQGPQAQTGAWNPQTGMYEAWNPQTGMYEPYRAGAVIGNYDPATDAAYQQAMQALRDAQAQLPQFQNSYGDELQSIYDQIRGRDPFRYDLDADMLYQQYRQQYINQGQQAMRDTMGQAAGLTGGYGSTYAQNAGQQAYNSYLQQLNDRIPELEERAHQRWLSEGERLKDQYTLARDMSNNEYQQFRDAIADYWNNLGFLDSQAQQAYQRGSDFWSRANTLNNEAENRSWNESQAAAQANRDAVAREQYAQEWARQMNQDAYDREITNQNMGLQTDAAAWNRAVQEYQLGLQGNETAYQRQQDEQARILQLMQIGYTPTDEDLMAAGMTTDQMQAWQNYIAAQNAPKGGGGGGGGDEDKISQTDIDSLVDQASPNEFHTWLVQQQGNGVLSSAEVSEYDKQFQNAYYAKHPEKKPTGNYSNFSAWSAAGGGNG